MSVRPARGAGGDLRNPKFVARVGGKGIFRHELLGDLPRKVPIDATLDVDIGKLIELKSRISLNSLRSRARSACSVSDCELTDTYSPAAIDMAPATSPATPASKTSFCVAAAAATPTIKLAVERMPSLAPSTAAPAIRCG